MEHKGFVFDTKKFNRELRTTIISVTRTNNVISLKEYINNNLEREFSPYTGDPLASNWEDELENGDVQELVDFAMTCFYTFEEEQGLGYSWDALMQVLQNSSTEYEAEYYILGSSMKEGEFILDPGGMGTGFVQAEDVPTIYYKLIKISKEINDDYMAFIQDAIYELTFNELTNSLNQLIELYKSALQSNKGLLMTF